MPDDSVASLVWALYSYIPPVLILGVLVWFCVHRTTCALARARPRSFASTALFAVVFGLVTVALNELLLKRLVPQPRPTLACVCSCARSSCFARTHTVRLGMPSGHSMVAVEFLVWLILELVFPRRRLVVQRKTVVVIFWAVVLLLPVPVSRVILHYHTVEQVVTGAVLGAVFGLGWFVFLAVLAAPRRWVDDLARRCCSLRHTYRIAPETPVPETRRTL